MNLLEGDILRNGNEFYRVRDFAKKSNDVIVNRILYHPKEECLKITNVHEYIDIDDVGKIYFKINKDIKILLEILKRKYKLEKLMKNDKS